MAYARIGICVTALSFFAGCLAVEDNPSRLGDNGPEIAILSGLNCWENTCFRFNAPQGTVSVLGREPVQTPVANVLDLGYVTPAEFTAISNAAKAAPHIEDPDEGSAGDGSSDDGSAGGGGSSDDGSTGGGSSDDGATGGGSSDDGSSGSGGSDGPGGGGSS